MPVALAMAFPRSGKHTNHTIVQASNHEKRSGGARSNSASAQKQAPG